MKKTILLLLAAACLSAPPAQAGKWKGFAVLGNGTLNFAYSDDARIVKQTGQTGIQHLYFEDYTTDYLRSTQLLTSNAAGQWLPVSELKETTLSSPYVIRSQAENASVSLTSHPKNAVIVEAQAAQAVGYSLGLRKYISTNRITELTELKARKTWAYGRWSNGVYVGFVLLSGKPTDQISVADSSISFKGKQKITIAITAAHSLKALEQNIEGLKADKTPMATAAAYWDKWLASGKQPDKTQKELRTYFQRNLIAARSANLGGQIPADITGQFRTQGMPQLYPRDAMKTARVMLLTGHREEAKQVIEYWQKSFVDKKSVGEWYARYNAFGKAINAGDGARYDEPEWDANGYFIWLINEYHEQTGQWLTTPEFFYQTTDFLVNKLDKNGLLYEGGIVEWTGYLPSTNLTCAAALRTASHIARQWNNTEKANSYEKAADLMTANLKRMIDPKTGTYMDLRTIDRKADDGTSIEGNTPTYLYDTSSLFGILWGYPDHETMQKTADWYKANTMILGGGLQYFDTPEQGLATYGHAAFFFTSAALVQYHVMHQQWADAQKLLGWMIDNSNVYGLMPERIYPDGSDCSPASPLSWCSAETALSILQVSKAPKK